MNKNDLTPELRKKAAACKSAEELFALAKSEGYELSDAEIEGISGGSDWDCIADGCGSFLTNLPD